MYFVANQLLNLCFAGWLWLPLVCLAFSTRKKLIFPIKAKLLLASPAAPHCSARSLATRSCSAFHSTGNPPKALFGCCSLQRCHCSCCCSIWASVG